MLRFSLIFLTVLILSSSPTFAADSLDQLVRNAAALKLNLFGNELLKPEDAFEFSATAGGRAGAEGSQSMGTGHRRREAGRPASANS